MGADERYHHVLKLRKLVEVWIPTIQTADRFYYVRDAMLHELHLIASDYRVQRDKLVRAMPKEAVDLWEAQHGYQERYWWAARAEILTIIPKKGDRVIQLVERLESAYRRHAPTISIPK